MDDSFVVDANSNIISSTPTKDKNKFICPHCSKPYLLKFYYDKHVATHASSAAPTDDSVISSILDISKATSTVQFKKPTLSKVKRVTKKPQVKPKFVCTYCLKGYLCQKSYKTHIMVHRIQDAAARYPKKDKVLENVNELSSKALALVCDAPSFGETGAIFKQLTKVLHESVPNPKWTSFSKLIFSELLDCVVGEKFLLPSVLLAKLLEKAEWLLSDDVFCSSALNMLDVPEFVAPTSDLSQGNMGRQFLLEFVLDCTFEIISFISKSVCGDSIAQPRLVDTDLDEESRNVIYYIGGSIVRGYFRMAHRYKSNSTWCQIAQTLRQKVITDDPSNIPDASWTRAISRGGLLFISPLCQEFLLGLTTIVLRCEKPNGSIDYSEIIKTATNSNIIIVWDSMIGNSLSDTISLNLMNDVIKFFCRTCGRGFARKRLNHLRERPVISMTTRHLAATRKGRK